MLTKENWLNKDFIFQLLNLLPVSIFWKDKEGRYLGCNDNFARALGLNSIEEILGKTDDDLVTKSLSDHYRKDDQEVILLGKPKLNIEEEQHFSDGRKVLLLTNKVPIFNKNKEVIGILGVYNDITELQKARLAAEAANKVKTVFIANMSHDIRTPLSSIIGLTDLLENHSLPLQDINDLKLIKQSAKQLLGLLEGILDVASLEYIDETNLKKESFSLLSFSQGLKEIFLPSVRLKNLIFHLDVDSFSVYVINDRVKLERILLNLIANAIKFTLKGKITLSIKKLSESKDSIEVEFRVSDTGLGISSEQIAQVFDPFFRIDSSQEASGYGMGLCVVKKFVTLLGGQIQVCSQLKEGSTFFFSLSMLLDKRRSEKKDIFNSAIFNEEEGANPLALIPLNAVKKEAKVSADLSLYPDKKSILFIEDNSIALKVGKAFLESEKYVVCAVHDPVKALHLAKTKAFDLILTDIALPGITGKEFVMIYRYWEKTQHRSPVPIIALTAELKEQGKQECFDLGMNGVWLKPLTKENLASISDYFIAGNTELASRLSLKRIKSRDKPNPENLNFVDLVEITIYPLFDDTVSLTNLKGDKCLQKEVLALFKKRIDIEIKKIRKAEKIKDWKTLRKLAHKLKGGATYAGAVRLNYACENYLRYYARGQTELLETLAHQLEVTLKESGQVLK